MKSKYTILKETYEKTLDKLLHIDGDLVHDFSIEYRTIDGELIRFSWLDRNLVLEKEENKKDRYEL